MEPGQMNDYGDVATEPRQQMAKERRPALAVIGLFIAGIGVVLLLIVTFMFLTGTTGGLRKSVLNSLEQSADEQEVYRSEVSSTLYEFGRVSACNRPIASSPADRPEGFLPTRYQALMLKNTRPSTGAAVPLPKRRLLLGMPSTLSHRQATVQIQAMSQQRHQRIQAQQTRRGPFNRQVRPLTLGLKAQVGTALFEGRLNAPALDETRHDITCLVTGTRREEGPWWALSVTGTYQDPPERQHWLAAAVP